MVINRQRAVRVSTTSLGKFLSRVRRTLKLDGSELTVCLVTNKEMARMNKTFRGKTGPTDVLSFPSNSANGGQRKSHRARNIQRRRLESSTSFTSSRSSISYLGDIAIAPEFARRNAQCFGRSLDSELRILILHGVLHLLGYDHETDNGQMDRRERQLRRSLKLEPACAWKARD